MRIGLFHTNIHGPTLMVNKFSNNTFDCTRPPLCCMCLEKWINRNGNSEPAARFFDRFFLVFCVRALDIGIAWNYSEIVWQIERIGITCASDWKT